MKLVTFLNPKKEERVGFIVDHQIFDLQKAAKKLSISLPSTIIKLLSDWQKILPKVKKVEKNISLKPETSFTLLSPIPQPASLRDGYAFRQHVEAARRNRGLEMVPQFDQFPIFYYSNHHAICGEGAVLVEKDHLEKLDFELEVAIVIGKEGKNIESKNADSYIAGFMIMNDFSARELQSQEMLLSLGPAKGKDFATALGPWLVTPDELSSYKISSPFGNRYDLSMTAAHNGKVVSHGNMKDMNWTFAEIIERVSYGSTIYPGDVIGSGTVGTGCYMELNGTWARKAKEKGESFTPIWLKAGDTIELEVAGLGLLKNQIIQSKKDYSILEKRKNV